MILPAFKYLKDNGIGGVGQMYPPTYGQSRGGAEDNQFSSQANPGVDLSMMGFLVERGYLPSHSDPAYEQWVTSKLTPEYLSRIDPTGQVKSMGDGNVNIPDQILATNMDSSFNPLTSDFAKFFGASLGLGAAGGALSGALGGAGAGTAGAGAGGAMDMGVGLQGWMDSLGASAAGGAGAATGGIDWSNIDQMISNLGTGAGEAENLATAQSIKSLSPNILSQAAQALKTGSSAKSIADALGISESAVGLIGKIAATGLGIYGANQQQDTQARLAREFADYGAPYRARLAESYADPAAFLKNSPDINAAVDQGTNALARSLSTQGNPAGSGRALTEIQDYATKGLYGKLGSERDRLAGFGGLTAYNQAAPQAAQNAASAESGVPNAIGAGINSITAPIKTTYQTMMDFFNQPGVA